MMDEVRIDVTEYYDEFITETTLWISEKQRQDVRFITSFYADAYEKSLLHKVIRFFRKFYK